jgi:histidyl-tRNA synthetase
MARTQGGKRPSVDVYVVALTPEAQRIALKMATGLRRDGIAADLDLMGRAMKGQLKDASRSGARFAAIIGQDEVASETVTLKDLSSGEQESIPRNELPERIYR